MKKGLSRSSVCMKIFQTHTIREIDNYTIVHEPVSSVDLMERASAALYQWMVQHTPPDARYMIFAGPGNNGGDALALARMLAAGDREATVYILKSEKYSDDFSTNLRRLRRQGRVPFHFIEDGHQLPDIPAGDIVIDGLFGSGITRPLDGLAAALVNHLNSSGARIIAVDMPSGLFGEDNSKNRNDSIIRAAITLTFQFPRLAFFMAENHPFVGSWHVLPIGLHQEYIDGLATRYHYLTADDIRTFVRKRNTFSHKGHFGHSLLISGCFGKMGAAVLAARACLRAGTGLLTVHVPRYGYEIMQTAVPEAMISIDASDILFSGIPGLEDYTAVGIGPGLGCRENSERGMKDLLDKCRLPLVIDADGINILGRHKEWLELLPVESILTPHPKEFERIDKPVSTQYERVMRQLEFAVDHKVYVVLKGAYTSIAFPDGTCWFNSTGNPGMATAGSGDVLTGIILSLLAQRYPPGEAARLGVFIHGLAGDLAKKRMGEEALIAGDIIDHLGAAFKKISNEEKR